MNIIYHILSDSFLPPASVHAKKLCVFLFNVLNMGGISNPVSSDLIKECPVQYAHQFPSEKMLKQELKQLQALDLIEKKVNPDITLKVEYSKTSSGNTLVPLKHMS